MCVLESLETVHLLGVGFTYSMGLDGAGDVLVVFCFSPEDGNCLLWYDGACIRPLLVDVVFWECGVWG